MTQVLRAFSVGLLLPSTAIEEIAPARVAAREPRVYAIDLLHPSAVSAATAQAHVEASVHLGVSTGSEHRLVVIEVARAALGEVWEHLVA